MEHYAILLVLLHDDTWGGEELLESFTHTDGTTTRTATTMRCGECLVQVDVADVEAHVARTAGTKHGVQVGSVVVHQTAAVVHEFGDFGDGMLEDTQRVGIGHHHGCHLFTTFSDQALQVVHVDSAIGEALHLDYIQSADSCRGRVGAMGGVGNEHFRTLLVATAHVIGTDDHQTCELTMCTGAGIQRELAETS